MTTVAAKGGKPLCIDLFCGLGGRTEGFLAEGWDVIGFDIERHRYPTKCQHCQGTGNLYCFDEDGDFLECDCYEDLDHFGTVMNQYPAQLVLQDVLTLHGSQFRNASMIVASPPCQEYSYMAMPWSLAKKKAAWYREDPTRQEKLTALFRACFRIAKEAAVPVIVENVRGAQEWIGESAWNFGSIHLWGDVPALVPHGTHKKGMACWRSVDGKPVYGGPNDPRRTSSKSKARKRASALAAKIPLELSSYIARVYKPERKVA